ncbi:MAG: winged helix-turn-helix domain-containing protein [Nanoarchaeota archaeon]
MTSKRRTKIEIIYDILKAIQNRGGQIKPTHLLYKSNLSHKKMIEYVGELIEKEMMRENAVANGNKMYVITNKGLNYIAQFKQIQQFSDAFGIR